MKGRWPGGETTDLPGRRAAYLFDGGLAELAQLHAGDFASLEVYE